MKRYYLLGLTIYLFFQGVSFSALKTELSPCAQAHQRTIKDHNDERIKLYSDLIQTICKLSDVYLYEVRLDDAFRLLNSDILKLIDNKLTPEDKVRLRTQLGKIMIYENVRDHKSFDKVLKILYEVEKKAESLNNKALLADVEALIGWGIMYEIYCFGGPSYDPSLKYFKRALKLRQEIDDKRGVAESLMHVALVYQSRENASDDQEALLVNQQAYRMAEEGNYKLVKSFVARHIGWIYRKKGELDKALTYFKESLVLREEVGFKFFLPPSNYAIGIVFFEKNDLDQALKYFQRALTHAEELGLKRHVVFSLIRIGDVKKAKKEKKKALKNYHKALKVAKSMNFDIGISESIKRIKELSENE